MTNNDVYVVSQMDADFLRKSLGNSVNLWWMQNGADRRVAVCDPLHELCADKDGSS